MNGNFCSLPAFLMIIPAILAWALVRCDPVEILLSRTSLCSWHSISRQLSRTWAEFSYFHFAYQTQLAPPPPPSVSTEVVEGGGGREAKPTNQEEWGRRMGLLSYLDVQGSYIVGST